MMNNQFNTTNITQHGIQLAQHAGSPPSQASAAVLNTFLNAQQQQQQLAAAVAAGAIYSDPRQLQINANSVDKNYYTTPTATFGAMTTPQRFYSTADPSATVVAQNPTVTATTAHPPNTILITNNFSHQQAGQSLSPDHQRNIRIVTSTSNPLNQTDTSKLATTASGYQHAHNVFNLNNNKHLQHLFPQHLLPQSSFQPTTTELLQQHFTTQTFPPSLHSHPQQNHATSSAIQMPHFYMSPENSITTPLNSNHKVITNIPSNNATSVAGSATSTQIVGNGSNANNSPVVLDRINICINNLYTDTSSSSTSNSLASTPAQQPSPIIPAIQHKPIIEHGSSLPSVDIYESNVLVIDEPDSTTTATTPHTPPTTPENSPPSLPNIGNTNNNSNANNNVISTTSSTNNLNTLCNYHKVEKSNVNMTSKQSFVSAAQNIEEAAQDISDCDLYRSTTSLTTTATTTSRNTMTISQQQQRAHDITTSTTASNTPITPPTPPSPAPEVSNNSKEYLPESEQTLSVASVPLFANGEDVFIKRHDDRFYLGTVIDTARNQFLVRFDDKTEVWCEQEEMRKFGVSSTGNNTSAEEKIVAQPMCVACKHFCPDSKVEICERCGRGYHLKCTSETSTGSNIWLCKRCQKPMKLEESSKFSSGEEETDTESCPQLHYNVESLTWDDKHRTNVEQIYCYCGKSGKFDNNMLQCWRCLNWYHIHCTQKLRSNLLRGDCFFVFCCSVCNYGDEYLRRIQASWEDAVHLVLYNLSILKKHHKFHHLLKDVNPYVLEKRKMLPIPKEWILMQDKEFLDKFKSTLNANTQLFLCGKEIKRDINSFALRSMEPPVVIKFAVKSHDIFNDELVLDRLKQPILRDAPENVGYMFLNSNTTNLESIVKSKRKFNEDSSSHDVYDFDDTSEDEIPIKHILDKVKKTKLSPLSENTHDVELKVLGCMKRTPAITALEKMDVGDDNANYALITSLPGQETSSMSAQKCKMEQIPKKEGQIVSPLKSSSGDKGSLNSGEKSSRSLNTKQTEKSSRKRKAFTLSKNYSAAHLIDSSSDENSSSSSRGTSLDLIIPPPKNFLGQNNPFRIISPKKNISDAIASTCNSKKSVSFGIFNTTALNFSSKLAALKSAGLFPKLSTSNLAKAAGQPRTVRTIKRRLSAKDITIGPNKEVRRRRTRRLSSNIEVISTTTFNPIPTNFFPIQAKDLLAAAAASTTTAASLFATQIKTTPSTSSLNTNNNTSTSASSSPNTDFANADNATAAPPATSSLPSHGRRLRQRPQKASPNTSRRSSVSSNQSSTSSASAAVGGTTSQTSNSSHQSHEDLKQTVNKYFGIVNRIESGENFSIRAKRQLANGQMQYLIEWGETSSVTPPMVPIQDTSDQTSNSQLIEPSTTI